MQSRALISVCNDAILRRSRRSFERLGEQARDRMPENPAGFDEAREISGMTSSTAL
jgi:hypothetical protein